MIEQRQRDVQGQPIHRMTWGEAIFERQTAARHFHEFRILLLGDIGRGVAHQRFAGHEQCFGILRLCHLAPALEGRARMNLQWNALRIERDHRFLVHEHVLASRLVLELRNLRQELPVMSRKGSLGRELVSRQRLAQEYFMRHSGVDRGV